LAHDGWHIEIDIRPTGHFLDAADGFNDDGTIDAEGYGSTVVQRAKFVVTTIRDHLRRRSCTHHLDNLDVVTTALGTSIDWCPTCGIRLPVRRP
jgi:hypothetical protein